MPARRVSSNAEFVSNLPVFVPKIIAGTHASVECPHCGGEFQIEGKRWRAPLLTERGTEIVGRSCPYCMKVARVPPEFYPRKRAKVGARNPA